MSDEKHPPPVDMACFWTTKQLEKGTTMAAKKPSNKPSSIPIPPPVPPLKTWLVELVGATTIKVQADMVWFEHGVLRFVTERGEGDFVTTLFAIAPGQWLYCKLIED